MATVARQPHRGTWGALALGVLVACGDSSSSSDGDDGSATGASTGATMDSSTGSVADDSGGDSTGAPDMPPDVEPVAGGLRLLLADQYVKSVRVLLGPEAAAAAHPPDDQARDNFDAIGAREVPLSPTAVEEYEESAIDVARAAIDHPGTLAQTVPCVSVGPHDDACYGALVRDFGRLAWRRPLTPDEIGPIVDIANAARAWANGDFMRGVQYAVATLLQSPHFIYTVEIGEQGEDGKRWLTRDETVTRLALFVLGRVPDAVLFARAEAGDLDDAAGVRAVAGELLAQPDAHTAVQRFYDELLRVRELPQRTKDPMLYPDFTPELAESMRQETLLLVNDVVFGDEPNVLRLFDADYTYVDPRLAEFYGLPTPASGVFERMPLPAEQRRVGLLTQAALLAVLSHPDRNSPTRRGLFVQRTILCNEVPPPPGDVDTTLPEPSEPTTLRSVLEQHLAQGGICVNCHSQTDPVGFAFEYYDTTGRYRETDNGYPVDGSGAIEGIGSWNDASELALLVRDDSRLPMCLVRNLYRHALGETDGPGQVDALVYIHDAFVESDHSFQQLVVELAANPAFRLVGEPK